MRALDLLRSPGVLAALMVCTVLSGCDQIHSGTRCQLQADDDGAWAQYVTAQMISPGACPLRLDSPGPSISYHAALKIPINEAGTRAITDVYNAEGDDVGFSTGQFTVRPNESQARADDQGSYQAAYFPGCNPLICTARDDTDIAMTRIILLQALREAKGVVYLPYVFNSAAASRGPTFTRGAIRSVKKGRSMTVRAWRWAGVSQSQTWTHPTATWFVGGSAVSTTSGILAFGTTGSPTLFQYSASKVMNTAGTFTWRIDVFTPPYGPTVSKTLTVAVVP
jgi:hypothetical protein